MELLEKAGIAEAKIFISTLDSPKKNVALVDQISKHYPHIDLFVRSKNRNDAYELIEKSVAHVYRESLHTSVQMGVDVLGKLGHRRYTATRKAKAFVQYDEEALVKLARNRNHKESYIESVKEEIRVQEKLLTEDVQFSASHSDSAWDSGKRNEKL
jgi:CPA2 family monovalent cation:H+ antiporter-2